MNITELMIENINEKIKKEEERNKMLDEVEKQQTEFGEKHKK